MPDDGPIEVLSAEDDVTTGLASGGQRTGGELFEPAVDGLVDGVRLRLEAIRRSRCGQVFSLVQALQ